jgi:hypothetical protein
MDSASVWRGLFEKWPKDLPHRGVLVTNFDEQIPFEGFLAGDTLLLIDRRTPDTMGARKVIIPFANIVALKLTDVLKAQPFTEIGFRGSLASG